MNDDGAPEAADSLLSSNLLWGFLLSLSLIKLHKLRMFYNGAVTGRIMTRLVA